LAPATSRWRIANGVVAAGITILVRGDYFCHRRSVAIDPSARF
jgi:hypothetical protein